MPTASRALPKVPRSWFSVLGDLPITLMSPEEADEEDFYGQVSFRKRTVRLDSGSVRLQQWVTLWHEATHIALFDAGVQDLLDAKVLESVCDAMGSYLTAMMLDGRLKVSPPSP